MCIALIEKEKEWALPTRVYSSGSLWSAGENLRQQKEMYYQQE